MADIPMAATTTGILAEARSAPRLLFIDNIRWSMIIPVLSMHACDTYSRFGNWYYTDRQTTGFGAKVFFGVYQSFLHPMQALDQQAVAAMGRSIRADSDGQGA